MTIMRDMILDHKLGRQGTKKTQKKQKKNQKKTRNTHNILLIKIFHMIYIFNKLHILIINVEVICKTGILKNV